MLFAAPAVIGLFIFAALPFLAAVAASFSNAGLSNPLSVNFVGLEQYRRIFADPSFISALRNNFIFAIVVVPLQTILALGLALLLNQQRFASGIFRSLFFLPVVFPMSLVSIVWILLYAPGAGGMLNTWLHTLSFGLIQPIDFLHDERFAMPAIMLLSIWQGLGFQMVLLLAALQGIPKQLYEAASIDGAGKCKRLRYITIPQLRNMLIFTSLITTILAFRLFDQVHIMTRGGPNNATTTVIFEAVRAVFERGQLARASAMTVVFFLIVFFLTLLQRMLVKERREIG